MGLGDLGNSNRPTHTYARFKADRLEESLNNTATVGTVTSTNKEDMTVQVDCLAGELNVRAFVMAQGSADYSQWIPPVKGDKVLLISDNGDFNNSYAFPVRLPSGYTSNIPDGMEIQAGNFSFRYDKEDNRYLIVNGDREIVIDTDKVELSNSNTAVTVNPNNVKVTGPLGEITVGATNVNASIGPSSINLTPVGCTISVPGGTLVIGPGTLSFNGQEVVRV
jgi:phage baseplate assembly protein gpV